MSPPAKPRALVEAAPTPAECPQRLARSIRLLGDAAADSLEGVAEVGELLVDPVAVELDEQERSATDAEICAAVLVDVGQRASVEELDDGGAHRAARDGGQSGCPGRGRVEERRHRAAGDRDGAQPDGRTDDDPEHTLRADEQRDEVEPGDTLDRPVADRDELAVGEHHVESEHRLARHAVLRAAQTPGVGGDVAADRRDLVARGVRRIEQAPCCEMLVERSVEHPRFHDGDLVERGDLHDAVEPLRRDDELCGGRRGSAGKTRARAARHDRHTVPGGGADDVLHLLGGGRERDGGTGCCIRTRAPRRSVVEVGDRLDRGGEHRDVREARGEVVEHVGERADARCGFADGGRGSHGGPFKGNLEAEQVPLRGFPRR